jgi:hypothetical protein
MRLFKAMLVVHAPKELRVVTGALGFVTLFAILQAFLAAKAAWWSLPLSVVWTHLGVSAVLWISISILMIRGKSWALQILKWLFIAWNLSIFFIAVSQRNFILGIFLIALGAYCSLIYSLIRTEMNRSYFNPGLSWYQQMPQLISGLECEWVGRPNEKETARKLKFRVSQLDEAGAFLYSGSENVSSSILPRGKAVFSHRGNQVECDGRIIRFGKTENSIGIRFVEMSADVQKDLGDFVEYLRGEGYV